MFTNLGLDRAFSSFKHKNYTLFFIGQLISLIGTWMSSAALGWLVYELTNKESYLGIVAAVGTLPSLLFTLPAGVFADRVSKIKIVLGTQISAMVTAFILAMLVHMQYITVWQIILLSALNGAIMAVDVPARQTMMMDLVGREDLTNAVALNSSIFNGTRMVGPVIAGWIVAVYGTAVCFFLNAVSYIGAVAALMLMRVPETSRVEKSTFSMTEQILQGVRYVKSRKIILNILIVTAVSSMFAGQAASLMPAYAKSVLHVGAQGYGFLMGAIGLGAFVAAVFVAAVGHRFNEMTLMVFGSLISPIGMLMLKFSPVYLTSIFCFLLVGFGMMMFYAVSNSYVQMDAPENMRGRVIGIRTLSFMGVAPIGALIIGYMGQTIGVTNTYLFCALTFLISSLWYMVIDLHRKQL